MTKRMDESKHAGMLVDKVAQTTIGYGGSFTGELRFVIACGLQELARYNGEPIDNLTALEFAYKAIGAALKEGDA